MFLPSDRFAGCLLGLAVGDALGAPFEGIPADHVFWTAGAVSDLLREATEPLHYTDDTQMMINVAETLIQCGEIQQPTLRERFLANYEAKRGYGPGARQILERAAAGENWDELAKNLFPGGSFGNGAAMRVAPVGLLFADDLSRVAEQARLSALPTHRHPLGIEGAVLLAVAVALAVREPLPSRREFYAILESFCESEEFRWQVQAAAQLKRHHSLKFLGHSLPAHRSVVTAIACFTVCPESFPDVIENAIVLGDDTDTLAAMAGALCGAHLGLAGIPAHWLERLENGKQGREYLLQLAESLHQQYQRLQITE